MASLGHRWTGWFWPQGEPERRVAGILEWSDTSGAQLELIGGFSGTIDNSGKSDRFDEVATIYGDVDGGSPITMWSCHQTHQSGGSRSTHVEVWIADWVCTRTHIPSEDQSFFISARLHVDGLYYLADDSRFCTPVWTKIEGVDYPGETLMNGTRLLPYFLPIVGGINAEVSAAQTELAVYRIATRATAPIVSPATEAMSDLKLGLMTRRSRHGPQITLRAEAWASIDLYSPSSASDLVKLAAPVLDYVALATYSPAVVSRIGATTSDGINAG